MRQKNFLCQLFLLVYQVFNTNLLWLFNSELIMVQACFHAVHQTKIIPIWDFFVVCASNGMLLAQHRLLYNHTWTSTDRCRGVQLLQWFISCSRYFYIMLINSLVRSSAPSQEYVEPFHSEEDGRNNYSNVWIWKISSNNSYQWRYLLFMLAYFNDGLILDS